MKTFSCILSILLLSACSAGKTDTTKENSALYEILTQQSDGGATIQFYEILNESKEIAMLKADENLKNKITAEDLNNSNFVILNMGEKPSGGYSISVDRVEELENLIILHVKENAPQPGEMTTMAITYPYSVVKVKSKKQIVVK